MQNIFWNYKLEGLGISAFISALGTFVTFLLGGWDKPLQFLLLLMLFDFILGSLSALKNRSLDSKVMFWGGINKILVLMLVALSVFIDYFLPAEQPFARTAVIFFYCGREGLSLIENCGLLGMPIPPGVAQFFKQLKDKGDENYDKNQRD